MRTTTSCLAMFAAAVLGTHAWQTPGAPATGVLLGRVVDADAATPLSGIVVVAVATPDPDRIPPSGQARAVLTDTQGRFVFRQLPKGVYTVTASTGGYGYSPSGFIVSGRGHQIGAYINGGYGQRRPGGALQPIDLTKGPRQDELVIRMWKGGAITGRVFDEAGEPLVDVAVAAAQRSSDGQLLTGPSTRTDDRGVYRLPTLTPGAYLVVVPQTQILMPASTLETLASLPPDPSMNARFGNVGAPLLYDPVNPATAAGIRLGSSVSSGQGNAGVTNALPPSSRAGRLLVYQSTFYPSSVTAGGATAVTIRSGQERAGADIHLQPVPAAEVSGTLMGESGPVAGFGVRLLPADGGDGASVLEVAATSTDARGAFVLPAVPSGSYTLLAMRTAAPPQQSGATSVAEMPGAWARQTLTVSADPIANVTLMLRPGVRVSGRLNFAGTRERPPADRLRQFPIGLVRARPLSRSSPATPTAVPAGSGAFTIDGVAPGRYLVTLREPPGWSLQSVAAGGREFADTAIPVGDADLADLVIVLTDQPAAVIGAVGGDAAADASVFLFPADRGRWPDARVSTRSFRTVRPGPDGSFSVANVLPGTYLAAAIADEFARDWPDESWLAKAASIAIEVHVQANQTLSVALRTGTLK